jgi:hypothetical protein
MFGHELRYEIKVTFGEISFKLHQTNWNVAINNVNVVDDELPTQITIYICLIIDIWTRRRRRTSTQFGAIRPKWRASNENGAIKFSTLLSTPLARRKAFSESYAMHTVLC